VDVFELVSSPVFAKLYFKCFLRRTALGEHIFSLFAKGVRCSCSMVFLCVDSNTSLMYPKISGWGWWKVCFSVSQPLMFRVATVDLLIWNVTQPSFKAFRLGRTGWLIFIIVSYYSLIYDILFRLRVVNGVFVKLCWCCYFNNRRFLT
jgi:hypothetical protein